LDARSLRRDGQAWAAFGGDNPADAVLKQWLQIKAIKRILLRRRPLMGVPDTPSTKQISRDRSPGAPLHTQPTACHGNGRPAFGKRRSRLSPIPRTVSEIPADMGDHIDLSCIGKECPHGDPPVTIVPATTLTPVTARGSSKIRISPLEWLTTPAPEALNALMRPGPCQSRPAGFIDIV